MRLAHDHRTTHDLLPATAILVAGASAALLVCGALAARDLAGDAAYRAPAPPAAVATRADDCGLPAGIALRDLPAASRARAARWALLCADFEGGRLSRDEYEHERAALFASRPHLPAQPAPAAMAWASEVRSVSSQYSSGRWSAAQLLGPPNVYPGSGDNPHAWASRTADGHTETVEVGFGGAVWADAVELFETDHPGAVTSIEVIEPSGARHVVYAATAAPSARPAVKRVATFGCSYPVAAVRVTLASPAVPGWNEIDAIGLRRCPAP